MDRSSSKDFIEHMVAVKETPKFNPKQNQLLIQEINHNQRS